jgi:16S rRNA (guanine527-N7)-methyltransferase
MDWTALPDLFPEFERPTVWLPLLQRHLSLLEAAAGHTRVTSVAGEDAIQRHYAESLEIWRLALESAALGPGLVVDVGSGGGFPGIVIACVAREPRVVLIEPLQKRARLLVEIAHALDLGNVEVVPRRAEEAGRSALRAQADIVIARAVSPMAEVLEYTAPFARLGGLIALPKGSGLESELAAAGRAIAILGCDFLEAVPMRPVVSETLSVAMLRKGRPTPKTYPRRPGMPRQRPL